MGETQTWSTDKGVRARNSMRRQSTCSSDQQIPLAAQPVCQSTRSHGFNERERSDGLVPTPMLNYGRGIDQSGE